MVRRAGRLEPLVIVLENPADLPAAVRKFRRSRGLTLHELIVAMRKARTGYERTTRALSHQFSTWELGQKSPNIASLAPYLHVHHLALAVVSAGELDTATAWCDERDRGRDRCAMMDGHGGDHRTYAGDAF